MTTDPTNQFGDYLRNLRTRRRLGLRELARKANLDAAGLTRLERGQRTPMPDTLKALAPVLGVPMADLFAKAEYITPSDLPNLSTYLRVRYSDLSEQKLTSIDTYMTP
jgi:transcriptional regulator with XRE-family HTH domain